MTAPRLIAPVAAEGSRLETLRALREYTSNALDECVSARDRPPLLKQLREILAEIDDLAPPTEEVDPLDDFFSDDD